MIERAIHGRKLPSSSRSEKELQEREATGLWQPHSVVLSKETIARVYCWC